MDNLKLKTEESMKNEEYSSEDDDGGSENEEFYFESDHLALRGNPDYHSVLRTLVILEAQRIEAAKHIDQIVQVSQRALRNPEHFLRKLTSGEGLDVPGRINIQRLPKIKFEKYNVPIPSNNSNSNADSTMASNSTVNSTTKFSSNPISNPSSSKIKDENDLTVRGRVFDQSKPETFNQLWTCEEQRRLEELLVEYPPEPIEMRRFAKIAKALGNRTARQVASRLQKYFQKLHAAGLPVPGRIPRPRSYASVRKNRMVKHMNRPTTFFPSNYVPVNITEEDDKNADSLDPNYYRNGCYANNMDEDDTDNMMIVDEPSDTETDVNASDASKIAKIIKRVKRDRENYHAIDTLASEHNGYKCDYCDEDPIVGTRWHCTICKERSIDYCSDCFVTQAQTKDHHMFEHVFIGYRVNNEYRAHSDADCDDDEMNDDDDDDDDMHDDISQYINSPGDIDCDDKDSI